MKKRLRKKKRVGEYQEYLIELIITPKQDTDINQFSYDFVDFIESINCYCGGGFSSKVVDVCIELGKKMNNPLENKRKLEDWLSSCDLIESFEFGILLDSWYEKEIE